MSFLDDIFGATSHHEDTAGPPYLAPILRRDFAAAAPLLKKAMQQNDARAMGLMAAMTALGHGVEKDPVDACCWFRQAAVRGHVPSQAALGMCLAAGLGTARDTKEAAYWLYRAGTSGNRQAIQVLGSLAYRDHSIVGPHFSEDDLCRLVRQLHKTTVKPATSPVAPTRLH